MRSELNDESDCNRDAQWMVLPLHHHLDIKSANEGSLHVIMKLLDHERSDVKSFVAVIPRCPKP